MNILKNLLSKKEAPIKSYAAFWNWFEKNERDFYNLEDTNKRANREL